MSICWPSRFHVSAWKITLAATILLIALPVQVAWGWTCPQTISTPSCGLWQSPNDNNEVQDQASLLDGSQEWAGPKLAQTFKVGGSGSKTLYRLDVMFGNNQDQRSGVLKIWTWKNNSYSQTVAQNPIFTDAVDLTGREKYQLKSFYPRITVTGGTTYLFEFNSTGREPFPLVTGPNTSYGNGQVYVNGTAATADLWFRTYFPPSGSPLLPTFASSDPPQWTAPLSNAAPVTKEDYYVRVKNLAENQRCDGLLGCGPGSKQDALLEALLLRACQSHGDCHTDYLGNVVAMLKRADGWFRCSPGITDDCNHGPCAGCIANATNFASMERASLAYLRVQPEWGSIAPADHIQIRNMFLDSARALWSQRELGTHNRALAAALTYRIVLTIAKQAGQGPVMPGPTPTETADWEAYASSVWNDIWNNRDAEEDSQGYVTLEWSRYFLEYTEVAGLESTVWNDPAFLKWIDRLYQQFTPLGVAPDYGHGGGWANQNSAPIWMFEKAAAMTHQPKYKWLAHRIFEHTRDRVCECAPPCPWNPPPGGTCPAVCSANQHLAGDAFFNDMASITGAYLAADDTIQESVPGAQVEAPDALQSRESATVWTGTPSAPVGQTFRITQSPLVRIDLKIVDNGGSTASGTLKVWKWYGTYAATVGDGHVPLYQEQVKMDAPSVVTAQSFFPFIDGVDTADTYFLEISRPATSFGVGGSSGAIERYSDGQLYANGALSPTADLWFSVYTLSKDGSTYTERQHWVIRPYSQWGNPPKVYDIQPGVYVPDKLTLRSGYDTTSMHAVFNLTVGFYGHGEIEPGALASLIDRGSVLMTETAFPYWQYSYQDEDESMAMMRRYWGGTNGAPGDRTTVSHFTDYRRATAAWIDWNDIHGWRVAQQRRIYFVKDRFLLVRDNYRFPSLLNGMRAAIGPVWHLADVRSEHGSNWYDVYNRQPVGNVYEVRNPERYALLYFVDRANMTVGEFREPNYGPGPGCTIQPIQACEVLKAEYLKPGDCRNSPPYVAYQRRVLDATPNQSVWFDTLIWPHDGQESPSAVVARVTKRDIVDVAAVALEVRVPVAGANEEIWTIVDNPKLSTITSGNDLVTDARYLVARRTAGAPNSNYLLATEATQVRIGAATDPERIDYTWAVRNTVEIGGNYPACPAAVGCSGNFCVDGFGHSGQCAATEGSCGASVDSGLRICTSPDGAMECPEGQSVHLLQGCPCECLGDNCGNHSVLVCQ